MYQRSLHTLARSLTAALCAVLLVTGCDIPSCMSETLSPSATPTFPATLSGPSDTAACNAASVNTPFTAGLNGIEAGRMLHVARLAPPRYYASRNGTHIVVPALGSFVSAPGGTWTVLAAGGATDSPYSIQASTALGSSLGNNTTYYLYASISTGTLAWVVSTTGPDQQLQFMTSDTNKAFIGVFFTNSSGVIIPFVCHRGRYRFTAPEASQGGGDSRLTIISATGSNVTYTALSIPCLPSFAQMVSLGWRADGDLRLYIYNGGLTATGYDFATNHYSLVYMSGYGLTRIEQHPAIEVPDPHAGGVYYRITDSTGPDFRLFQVGFDY